MMESLLKDITQKLKTREDIERALALMIACTILPNKSDPQVVLLMISDPTVGALLLTSKQAEVYSRVKLALHQQRS